MLDSLRAFSRTWYAKIFFAVLIVSFGAFGISNLVTDVSSTTVARVGTQDVSVRDFQRLYQQQVNTASQRFGSAITDEQAMAFGIPGAVLSQLTSDAAINQLALQMGVGVSQARLGKMLREDPSFTGTLGTFDSESFKRVLQQNGYTETEYFELQAKAARRQQLAAGLFADSGASKAALALLNGYQGDTRTLEYFTLNTLNIAAVPEPTDADLQAYLTEHQDQFRTTETRTATLLVLSPGALAAAYQPTEAEIAAEYEKEKAALTLPEKRTFKTVVVTDPAAIEAFTNGKTAGKTFDQLLTETGLTASDTGPVGKSEVLDPTLANTAFGLALNDYAVIPGIGGSKRIVTVTAIEGGGTPSLDDVRPNIVQQLSLAKARTGYLEIEDQVEEFRAAFKPLKDIADRFKLALAEVKLTAGGAELESVASIPVDSRAQVAAAIFKADPAAKLSPTIALGSSFNIFFEITASDPAHDQTLDEVRDAVTAAWTDEKTEAALKAEVDAITAALTAGKSFAEVAAAHNAVPQLSQAITRRGDGTTVINQDVAIAAFARGPDGFGSAKNEDGDYVLFHVVSVTPGVDNPATETFLADSTRDTIYANFVSAIRTDAGVRENAAVLNQLLNLTPGS